METKFNLYDLFAIFIPGATACIGFCFFLAGIGIVKISDFDWSATLILIPLAYVAGTAIHHFTRNLVSVQGLPTRLLSQQDQTFTMGFKDRLWDTIRSAFPLSDFQGKIDAGEIPTQRSLLRRRQYVLALSKKWWTTGSQPPPKRKEDEICQMAFDLCYDYVMQQGKGVYTENMNALYGMCRNMLTVILLLGLLATTYWSWLAIGRMRQASLPRELYMIAVWILVWILLLAITWMIAWAFRCVFHRGMIASAQRFAVSVYRSFFLARRREHENR
jgi:hypothetical protein